MFLGCWLLRPEVTRLIRRMFGSSTGFIARTGRLKVHRETRIWQLSLCAERTKKRQQTSEFDKRASKAEPFRDNATRLLAETVGLAFAAGWLEGISSDAGIEIAHLRYIVGEPVEG
jgi:hypothetical protein